MLTLNAAGEGEASSFAGEKLRVGHHRRVSSFSYQRLSSQNLIRLSILKLDNSTFDVEVARGATIQELKASIERLFCLLKDEGISISWSHVWSHFCLCFRNQMLTDDKATLRSLRITDGDQLRFVRHLSLEKLGKRKSKDRELVELPRSLPVPDMLTTDEIENSSYAAEPKRSINCDEINMYKTTHEEEISDDVQLKFCMFRWGGSFSRLKALNE